MRLTQDAKDVTMLLRARYGIRGQGRDEVLSKFLPVDQELSETCELPGGKILDHAEKAFRYEAPSCSE